jgi:hypothetical protein
MQHSAESWLRAMQHSTESWNGVFFVESGKRELFPIFSVQCRWSREICFWSISSSNKNKTKGKFCQKLWLFLNGHNLWIRALWDQVKLYEVFVLKEQITTCNPLIMCCQLITCYYNITLSHYNTVHYDNITLSIDNMLSEDNIMLSYYQVITCYLLITLCQFIR